MIQTYTTRLTKKENLTADVLLLSFSLDTPATLDFLAGQYMILHVPHETDTIRRLYSIASPSQIKNSFDLVAKIIPGGAASQYFLKMRVGDTITFDGPAGRFVLSGTQKHKVFLATGTGIAPMRSMLLSDLTPDHMNLDVSYMLLWGLPYYRDAYYVADFKKLAQEHPTFSFTICLSREESLDMVPPEDRSHFRLGRVTKDFQAEFTNTDYYICGNRDVVDGLKTQLAELKIDNASVIFEKF